MPMPTKTRAIYAGTFDPITNGHFDIIERASTLFSELYVCIGCNSSKKAFFALEKRTQLLSTVLATFHNVTVLNFTGLAIEQAKKLKAKILIRGLRTEADFEYEMQMAMMNRALAPELETIFIPTKQSLSHISSSLVKEIALLGGDISAFVPPLVLEHIKTLLTEKGSL